MRLSPEEVALFYKLYPALLLFTNERIHLEEIDTADQLMHLPVEKRWAIREALFKDRKLIDAFVESNPEKFTPQELDIVMGWKNFTKGQFYLLRQLKKYAIFLSLGKEPKAYGVLAIADLFTELVPFMPIMVDTLLLPFRGKIIYDGLLSSKSIYFGSGIKRSLNDSYNEAKAKYGIITTLSETTETEKATSDIDQLKYYLRSERNREQYWDDIQRLIRKSEQNKTVYYQEIGKYYAKQFGKRLRELGIESGWFGILEDVIIGSGKSKKEALSNIEDLVPKRKMNYIYLFQLRSKK